MKSLALSIMCSWSCKVCKVSETEGGAVLELELAVLGGVSAKNANFEFTVQVLFLFI